MPPQRSLAAPAPLPNLRRAVHGVTEGSTLLEVTVGIVVLTLSFSGLAAVFLATQRGYEQSFEEGFVSHAFRRVIEQMRDTNFGDIAQLYDGYQFGVDQVGGAGTVTIYLDETSLPPELGSSRDLDGDGDSTSVSVGTAYVLLPFRIEVRWTNRMGGNVRRIHGFLSEEG